MNFSGHVIQEIFQPVVISPLASKVYLRVPLTELESKGPVDLATVFGAADLTVNEQKVSSNAVFFLPDKQLHLPQVSVNAEIAEAGDGFDVKIISPVFARDVYVSFGDADVRFSDNYFDLLSNEPVMIHVTSQSSLEDLRRQMKVVSLVDAFPPVPSAK
jgi:beta-mannosidase